MKMFIPMLAASLFLVGCGGGSSTGSESVNSTSTSTSTTSGDTSTSTDTSGNQVSSKPNILLIIADDQGVDASAQYSYSTDLPNTPIINQIATQGIVFDNAWATPACTTTRGTLITGMHGINSDVSFIPAELDTDTFTLQRYLKSVSDSSNYQTAVIGKWHLGGGNPDVSHPIESGVDYYAGTISGTISDYEDWTLTIDGATEQSTEYHTRKMTDIAIDWLALQHQDNNPWFLWLSYVAPHSPFHLPPADLHNRNELSGTAEHIDANKREYYFAAIEAMDAEIGRLLSSMSTAERNNTIIIYIGDNGTPATVLDRQVYSTRGHSKGTIYEGGIRIPMIVAGNGVTRMGERETALVNTSDFYATFGQLLGATTTQVNDSFSFMDLLTTEGEGLREYNYSEFESTDVTGWTVRNADYKYIELVDGTRELYKVSDDLAEANDLLLTSENFDTLIEQLSGQGRLIRGE
ncbi:MAG: sulfatase-like hydrolase/transferase [Thiotrichaceae bacterium]